MLTMPAVSRPSLRRMACRAAWVLACFLIVALGAGVAFAQDVRSSQVLESFPVHGQAVLEKERQAYELSLSACSGGTCPFEVRLLSSAEHARGAFATGRAVVSKRDSAALDWPAFAAPARPLHVPKPGAAPFLANTTGPRVWSTGEEENTVTAAASAVPLEPGNPAGASALLVTQMAGFDHPKRRHTLYVASRGALKRAWSRSEPQGPYVSQVMAAPGDAPVYLSMFVSRDDDVPDKVSAYQLAWDARRQVFSERPSAPTVLAVVAGSYPTVRAARAARAASACFAGYGAVDTWPGKGLVPHRYALITLAAEPTQATAERERLIQCQAGIQARQYPLSRLTPRSSPTP
ncbi:hypothetical protein AVME950_14380 [Acidovorax sp. SUPP950]|nr:hypothetical protein AVME950_14380 [Acidovorax sp. SUPP950]